MLAYIERDWTGDMTIVDARTNRTICYMAQTCRAAEVTAKFRRQVERDAEVIVAALNGDRPRDAYDSAEKCWRDQAARIAELEAQLAEAERRASIRDEHAAWSQASFGDVSAVGPAKHLSKEALEVAADPTDIMEHVDCQFLLWDMQRRASFTDAQITEAMKAKMPILKARKYPPPKEGEAREHDRSADHTGSEQAPPLTERTE